MSLNFWSLRAGCGGRNAVGSRRLRPTALGPRDRRGKEEPEGTPKPNQLEKQLASREHTLDINMEIIWRYSSIWGRGGGGCAPCRHLLSQVRLNPEP